MRYTETLVKQYNLAKAGRTPFTGAPDVCHHVLNDHIKPMETDAELLASYPALFAALKVKKLAETPKSYREGFNEICDDNLLCCLLTIPCGSCCCWLGALAIDCCRQPSAKETNAFNDLMRELSSCAIEDSQSVTNQEAAAVVAALKNAQSNSALKAKKADLNSLMIAIASQHRISIRYSSVFSDQLTAETQLLLPDSESVTRYSAAAT